MRSRVSGNTVKSILTKRLSDHPSLMERLGQVTKAAAGLAIGEPITITHAVGELLSTCGAVTGIWDILEDTFKTDDAQNPVFKYETEKFDALYYTLCQKSYFEAIDNVLKSSGLKADSSQAPPGPLDRKIEDKIKRYITKLDSAEICYFLSVDPVTLNIPLYSVYQEWLGRIFERTGYDQEKANGLIRKIQEKAVKNFHLKLSEKSEISDWIRNYLILEHLGSSEERITDRLNGIESLLKGWLQERTEQSHEFDSAWEEYRERLMKLPDHRNSMFGETFGVREVFVCPEIDYYRQGFDEREEKARRHLETVLGGLISTRASNEDLIFLCGGPGSGKSTLCRLLCDQLARKPEIHPILLKLRKLNDCSNIRGFIEKSLRDEGLINDLKDLRKFENVILVLDGFDEVVMANKENLGRLFRDLKEELQTRPFRTTKAVIAGRDTLFKDGDEFPGYSHIIELKPFNEKRVRKWTEKWVATPHKKVCSIEFRPEIHVDSDEKTALHHLVTWPLTLHLLARVHAAGDINLSTEVKLEKAYIYKCIIYDTLTRQKDKIIQKDMGRLPPKGMHKFLKTLAWEMYLEGTEIVNKKQAEEILAKDCYQFPEQDLEELADTTILNAPTFKRGEDDTGVEFIHKSFGEYLTAEYIAEKLDAIHQKVTIEDTGEKDFRITDEEKIIHILAELLCKRELTDEIIEFLAPMVGTYAEYNRSLKFDSEYYLNHDRKVRMNDLIDQLKKRYTNGVYGNDLNKILKRDDLKKHNAINVHTLYITGLIKVLATAHLPTHDKKFNIYEGIDDINRLQASALLGGRHIWDYIPQSIRENVTIEMQYTNIQQYMKYNTNTLIPIRTSKGYNNITEIQAYDPITTIRETIKKIQMTLIEIRFVKKTVNENKDTDNGLAHEIEVIIGLYKKLHDRLIVMAEYASILTYADISKHRSGASVKSDYDMAVWILKKVNTKFERIKEEIEQIKGRMRVVMRILNGHRTLTTRDTKEVRDLCIGIQQQDIPTCDLSIARLEKIIQNSEPK